MTITDEQIDAIFDESPYAYRRTMNKRGHEVIKQTNDDWREVISDDQQVIAVFRTVEEARELKNRLHVRWVLAGKPSGPHTVYVLADIHEAEKPRTDAEWRAADRRKRINDLAERYAGRGLDAILGVSPEAASERTSIRQDVVYEARALATAVVEAEE